MKYGLILPALCAISLAMPALAQPAGRDPNSSIATQGPSAHDAMARAPSKPHRAHPRKHAAMHARSARKGSADTTANDLNREELARLQQPMAPSPPMPMPMEPNRALEGPKVSTGARR